MKKQLRKLRSKVGKRERERENETESKSLLAHNSKLNLSGLFAFSLSYRSTEASIAWVRTVYVSLSHNTRGDYGKRTTETRKQQREILSKPRGHDECSNGLYISLTLGVVSCISQSMLLRVIYNGHTSARAL